MSFGEFYRGEARYGLFCLWRGLVRQFWHGKAGLGGLGFGTARYGMAVELRRGQVGCVEASSGVLSFGMVWFLFFKQKFISMNKYQLKVKSLAKGIDPELIVQEFEKIENTLGALTPENIVTAAHNSDCVLHKLFEWDDSTAAHQFRLQQARNIINNVEVIVISNGESRSVDYYEIVRGEEGRQYKHIHALTVDEIGQVKSATLAELTRIKTKLSFYKQFQKVTPHIEAAIEAMR